MALTSLTAPGPDFSPSASLEVRLRAGTGVVELDTSGTIDVAAERRRLEKDLAAAQKELASTAAKLSNADFLAKAPEQVVGKDTRPSAGGPGGDRADHRQAGRAAMTFEPTEWEPATSAVPTPDEIASLWQV